MKRLMYLSEERFKLQIGNDMQKLLRFKEWLTIPAAALRLSTVCEEQVTEADVLRLALDGHLRLSIDFVNHARARCSKVVREDEAKWRELPAESTVGLPNIPAEAQGKPLPYMTSLNIDGERFLNLDEDVTTLRGVWDLPLIGAERIDIENRYQRLTGGPQVTLYTMEGAFVEGRNGQMCQLQEHMEDNEFMQGSRANLASLERHIAVNNIKPDDAELLLTKQREARKAFLEKQKGRSDQDNYYPAGGLPEDAVVVVRTDALREFERSINGAESEREKPLAGNERNSLLTIIAALCDYSDIDYKGRKAVSQICQLTEEIGAALSDDTVRRSLAKVPDALGSRMK